MSKYVMRRGVNQSLSHKYFTEYLEELAQEKIEKGMCSNGRILCSNGVKVKQPRIIANKNK